MKVVKVLWVDSCNSNMNWTVAEDIGVEPMYIDSFGIVVKDTDEFLAIAQNYGDNPEQYSNITTIPKGCIKEVFVIHEDNVFENEQKPADKVEPKFKVGDWIVSKTSNLVYRVDSILYPQSKCYYLSHNGGIVLVSFTDEQNYRLWTIKDAKDGDVLVTKNKNIFIFKSINDYTIYDYCGLYFERFTNSPGTVNGKAARQLPTDYVPATKEQRDLLFNKMHEARYEWDDEKKELRKIDKENLTEFEIAVKNVMEEAIEAGDTHNLKADAENLLRIIQPTWNKEDERILNSLISSLVRIGANTRTDSTSINYTFPREINWLKSLKQRMVG